VQLFKRGKLTGGPNAINQVRPVNKGLFVARDKSTEESIVLEHLLLVARSRAVQRPAPFACAKNKRAPFGIGSVRRTRVQRVAARANSALAPQTGHSSRFCSKMREAKHH
jgi:hypothetical protein